MCCFLNIWKYLPPPNIKWSVPNYLFTHYYLLIYHQYTASLSDQKSLDEDSHCLHLKGQMMYMCEWDCIMFLGTPM